MVSTISHDNAVIEMLSKDQGFALEYLASAFEEIDEVGGEAVFLQAVRRVIEARGGMSAVANATGLARPNLYRTLSAQGDPKLSTLLKILSALGIGLSKVATHKQCDSEPAAQS
ncbi:addiction module antidote protein [Pseudomonas sp. EL_65y_Pfl2_R95]|uniref:addiction module antidote protein n=1 Tax=Pseudomonas sp. EL_65y_Pfl2_R95 TaxID=3088698 RepID=UPI0030D705F7